MPQGLQARWVETLGLINHQTKLSLPAIFGTLFFLVSGRGFSIDELDALAILTLKLRLGSALLAAVNRDGSL